MVGGEIMTRTPETTYTLLRAYADIAGPILTARFTANACIAATAITIDVFAQLRIPAVPFPVTLEVYNRAMVERVERERTPPDRSWTDDGKCWSVGVGFPSSDPNTWAGHLIALVDNRYLVDASLAQVNRPAYSINLPPVLILPAPRKFRRKGEPFPTALNGCLLRYRPAPSNITYRLAPDWQNTALRQPIVSLILSHIAPVESLLSAL